MTIMRISNQIELSIDGLPKEVLDHIKKDLTFRNPEFDQVLQRGGNTHGKAEYIRLYRYEGGIMVLPRGYGKTLQRYLMAARVPFKTQDERLTLPSVSFESRIKLRRYQAQAVEALLKGRQGGVAAPCGAGKTMILLQSMVDIGQPALWITHTTELAEQVIKRATQVLDIEESEIGRIYGGKQTVGTRLTVALVQTLAKMDIDAIKDKFGCVLIDEAHHLAAMTFFHPVGQFPALYRIWASATPERSDGLTGMVHSAAGPVLHEISQKDVPTVIPTIEVIETEFNSDEDEYTKVIDALIKDPMRNDLLVRTIVKHAPDHYSLVLSERVEHLEILHQMLNQELPGMRIEILNGRMSKKARAAVMERANNKEIDVLLATQLAREGLDIPHLDRLFLAAPKRAQGAIQQEIGRIMRLSESKTDAVAFDFWDSHCSFLKGQFWSRREVYQKKIEAVLHMPNQPRRVAR